MSSVQRPVLCVVAEPNGSGKTSTTEKLLANEWTADSVYINPDNTSMTIRVRMSFRNCSIAHQKVRFSRDIPTAFHCGLNH